MEECAICLEKTEQVRSSCCKKPYCLDCFSKAIGLQQKCPTCRADVETEKYDTPGSASQIPKELLDPKKKKDLQEFLDVRLREHVSQIWSYNGLHNWQDVVTKDQKCEEYVAEPVGKLLATYDYQLLGYFDALKIQYFRALQNQLIQENALDPIIIRSVFNFEDSDKEGCIMLNMKVAIEYKKAQYEVYYQKPN